MIYVKSCPAPGTLELFVMLKIQAVKRLVLSIRHSLLKNSNLMYDQSEILKTLTRHTFKLLTNCEFILFTRVFLFRKVSVECFYSVKHSKYFQTGSRSLADTKIPHIQQLITVKLFIKFKVMLFSRNVVLGKEYW